MAKGGYQIVDFKGAVVGSTEITVPGIFEKVTQGKAVLFENVKIDASLPGLSVFVSTIQADTDTVYCTTTAVGSGGPVIVIVTIADDDGVTGEFYAVAEAE